MEKHGKHLNIYIHDYTVTINIKKRVIFTGKLSNLTKLWLSMLNMSVTVDDNQLTILPESIGNLLNLTELSLRMLKYLI